MLQLGAMTSISSSPSHQISHSVTIWESCWAQKCDPCLWTSRDELKHNGMKLATLPIRGIQWVWCANTIVSITSLTVSSCPDVFMDPQFSWAQQNITSVNCLWTKPLNSFPSNYWWGMDVLARLHVPVDCVLAELSRGPMSGLTSEVITQVLGEWIGLERRNSSQPVTGTSS